MDYFSADAVVKEPTPFAYEAEHRITVDQNGMDFGLIPLRDYYTMHLEANGVVPIPIAQWKGRDVPQFEMYAILGLPEEEQRSQSRIGERGPQIGFQLTLSLIGVRLQETPADRILSPVPRFTGVLNEGGLLGSVQGMSGGPILGISNQGEWHYACVAMQGSWDEKRRMIYGTPMSVFVDQLTKLLKARVESGQ